MSETAYYLLAMVGVFLLGWQCGQAMMARSWRIRGDQRGGKGGFVFSGGRFYLVSRDFEGEDLAMRCGVR